MVQRIADEVVVQYARAYERIHLRRPDDLRVIDHDWVILNGVRMSAAELQYLTDELRSEHDQSMAERRRTANRLVAFLSQSPSP